MIFNALHCYFALQLSIHFWSCSKYHENDVNLPEREGEEEVAGPMVELGLELHPVKTEGVQECGQALHQH